MARSDIGADRRLSARGTREVLEDHVSLREKGRLDEDLERNYHPEVVILTGRRTARGPEGLRELAGLLDDAVDSTSYRFRTLTCDGPMGLSEWTAEGEGGFIREGVDSYLVRDGKIIGQTIHYALISSELSVLSPNEPTRR